METTPPQDPQPDPQSYVRPQMVKEARPGAPARTASGTKWIWGFVILLLLVSLVFNLGLLAMLPGDLLASRDSSVQERFHSLNRRGSDKIAIIQIEGAILDTDGFVKKQIERVLKDDDVKGVVLRINSPGGTVSASDYLYHHLREMRKEREIPLVVSMGGICASGGYYLAMAVGDTEDSIYAEPSTWTGSIGVVLPHYDVSQLLAEWKIADDSVQSHPLKTVGSFTKPMTEEERAILQSLVDDSFARFKEIVVEGRPFFADDSEALDQVATGQVFSANQALEHRLVDEIGFVEKAIERTIELAGLDEHDVRVVEYRKQPTLSDALFGASAQSVSWDLAMVLDLTTPRAYYLWTSLPGMSGLARP